MHRSNCWGILNYALTSASSYSIEFGVALGKIVFERDARNRFLDTEFLLVWAGCFETGSANSTSNVVKDQVSKFFVVRKQRVMYVVFLEGSF